MTTDAQPHSGPVSEGVLDINDAANAIAAMDDAERPEDAATNKIEADSEAEASAEADEESDAEPTAEDSEADPDGATDDADDEEDAEEADQPPIQAPHSWDREAKAAFEALPRKMQEVISARENERDRVVSQKLNEAAEQRKAYEERASKVSQYAEIFDQLADQAKQRFAGRWDGVDWVQMAQRLDPADYQRQRAEYEADQQTLSRTVAAREAAEKAYHQKFIADETAKLREIAPEIVNSPEVRTELVKYASDLGVDKDALSWASAAELSVLHKAMLFDKMKAQPVKAKAAPTKPAPKAVRPASEAKTTPRNVQERDKAMKRLSQSGSVDDAVAAILAQGG